MRGKSNEGEGNGGGGKPVISQQEQLRLQELGDFLRTRRARLVPEHFGFPKGRRRLAGLKREEVAQLAGVSVDWYTWLEQGRPIMASVEVLESLVRALGLDSDEREHLFLLARQQLPLPKSSQIVSVNPTLQRFLDQQGQNPAVVTDLHWDVLAWNEAACVVFGDYSQMSKRQRNNVWRLFMLPSYRKFTVNWEEYARHVLAQFRASSSRFLDDPYLTELIHDLLQSSPEFRAWWPDHEVNGSPARHKSLNHPQGGLLLFDRLSLQVTDMPELRVTIYTPAEDTDTSQKLAQLLKQRRFYLSQTVTSVTM